MLAQFVSPVARWKSRLLFVSGLLTAALGLAATPAAAGPATPAQAAGDCPFVNSLCLFEQPNFGGERFVASSMDSSGACVSLVDHGWGDRARSAINTNSSSAAMFMNDDCLGGPFQVAGNSSVPDFGGFTPESVWVPR